MSATELSRARLPAPLRISLLYAAFGTTWILLGDLALWLQGGVTTSALLLELAKGGLFVAASALLLHVLVRREMTQRLRSALQLESVLATAPVGIAAVAADGSIRRWNAAAARILGWSAAEVTGRRASDIGLSAAEHTDRLTPSDLVVSDRAGDPVHIRVFTGAPESASDGGHVLVFVDRRREIQTEGALRRSQKLEAVGRLAGGIAHEFNNILTTVIGHAALLKESLSDHDHRREHAVEVHRSADRAAALTRQLLVFSGRQITRTAPVDVVALLKEMVPTIDPIAGDRVSTRYDLGTEVWRVRCDSSQLHQLVLNLVVNAREAMPDGGTITIRATNAHVVDAAAAERLPPGEYALLSISDTGRGMSPETLAHLFEPFFTTKEQGTGLGLATVHGIVQQFDGHIHVDSQPGRGSRFDIYLPRATPDDEVAAIEPPRSSNSASLLVVEDDDAVRELTCRILRRSGYTVLSARNGGDALDILRSGEAVDLVIADIVMPGMNGIELGDHIRSEFPHLPVLFTSGYVGPDLGGAAGLAEGSSFLAKPYRPEQLTARVSELLK